MGVKVALGSGPPETSHDEQHIGKNNQTRWSTWPSMAIFVTADAGDAAQESEPRKKPSYRPLYWLVNRDPYNGLL